MASLNTLKRLQALIWILIYGGLLTLVLGLATQGYDRAQGWALSIAGGCAAAIGFVLIFVRARLGGPDAQPPSKPRGAR